MAWSRLARLLITRNYTMVHSDETTVDPNGRGEKANLALANAGRTHYVKGCALVLSAGVLWSFTGTLTRVASHTDAMQYLAFRSLGTVLVFLLWNRVGEAVPVITRVGPWG